MNKKQKKMLIRIIITSLLLILLHFLPIDGIIKFIAYMIPYFIIGYDILRKSFKGIKNKEIFDENFLMSLATVGAIIEGLIGSGDYVEAVAVMLFYQIGELFQSYAVNKSRRNISELMDIRPDYANIEKDGKLEKVSPNVVEIGDIIVVQPGEKIPLDGVIIEGESTLDTAALTGESAPRSVRVGSEVLSGCINNNGVIKIKTTKAFGESTASKILNLVENASSKKSKSEDFISKFAKVYTPIVCICALALAIVPPVVLALIGKDSMIAAWIYRALTFLVVSCPCALVISIPLSFFAGLGGASKEGVLIKGSNYLETLSKVNTIVFDKTGTLTQGVFEVVSAHHNKLEEKEIIEIAALAESASSHPISKSIQKAYGKEIDRSRVSNIEEISGHGIKAIVDGKNVAVGNAKLMKSLNVEFKECDDDIGTIIHVAIDNEYHGHILIADVMKVTTKEAMEKLKKLGVAKRVMLTGDAEIVAKNVSEELKLEEYHSELLPQDKVEQVERLLNENGSGSLVFVGDGINDAPVLTRADIGIAMGAMGSDAAIEAADVVLMDDDPLKIVKAIKISRKCIGIVYQNIVFAITVKILCLVLSAFGITNMWWAIFADVGVMIIAVLNAIRALNVKRL